MRDLPMSVEKIEATLKERLDETSSWEGAGRARHVYPVTRPLAPSVQTIAAFWDQNANNIGAHLEDANTLKGTRRLEREVVRDVATLLNGPDAEGWLTTGGTEGNITGLWLARDRLTRFGEQAPVVLATRLAHGSVRKACRLLSLELVDVPLRKGAVMDAIALRRLASDCTLLQGRGVIVVATVGATLTGTCDPVDEIAAALPPDIPCHLHVDTTFAGLVLPFTDPSRRFDFRAAAVDTIVVDLHKMASHPLGVGVFLSRPGLTKVLTTESVCARAVDRTLLGSRPGAVAAAAWAGLKACGRTGLRRDLDYCLTLKRKFLEALAGFPAWRVLHDPSVNVVGIVGGPEGDPNSVTRRI
ncbi:MAG: aminotransferase class V-fold PLP-dependent enzyme, partial [Bryobacteraceae bacterium]|nr:aminotransferase class V-fold PLP-dependent enzyme [Bryobacteraceae bacterium]